MSKNCASCGIEFEPNSNSQKYCKDCSSKIRKVQATNATNRYYKNKSVVKKRRAVERKREYARMFFNNIPPDEFYAAVRYPPKNDVRVHIAVAVDGFPPAYVCGRSHTRRARINRPAPNRNVTCKRCLKIWKDMYGDLPVPIVASEWSNEDLKQYGFD